MKWVEIMLILFFVIYVLGMASMIHGAVIKDKAELASCKKVGMEYIRIDGNDMCLNKQGEAHYVKINCRRKSFFEFSCFPKIISIGNNRVVIDK